MTNETEFAPEHKTTEQWKQPQYNGQSINGYDAILLLSFGGPEGNDEVMPFLENVLRGKNVPRERMEAVAHHYYLFDGISPINGHCRSLIAALREELDRSGIDLPIFWGNRNWQPMLTDTLTEMKAQGVKKALAFVTSAYSSYSSCRQYLEDIEKARTEVGDGAPEIDKIRVFYNHPKFVETNKAKIAQALSAISDDEKADTHIAFTAHSIPKFMADNCSYESQLQENASRIASELGQKYFRLVYQSRSGPASQPWLEPDICDHLKDLQAQGVKNVVIAPIGFLSDHMEVIYDLDVEAKKLSKEIGIHIERAETAGTTPNFVEMVKELIEERLHPDRPKLALGDKGAGNDVCPANCCPSGRPQVAAGRP